jgi:hypothetical protein
VLGAAADAFVSEPRLTHANANESVMANRQQTMEKKEPLAKRDTEITLPTVLTSGGT